MPDCDIHKNENNSPSTEGWLKKLSEAAESTRLDSVKMQWILHKAGFKEAIVTCGVVYYDGVGSMHSPPSSIHTAAKVLLEIIDEAREQTRR